MINKKDINGIHYIVSGDFNSPQTLLCIHGAGCINGLFEYVTNHLTKYKCVAISLPGHGESDGSVKDIETVEEYTQSVLKFMESNTDLLGDNITLVGYSMGGFISLEIALEKLPQVKKVVLISTASHVEYEPKFDKKLKQNKLDMLFILKCVGSLSKLRTYKTLFDRTKIEENDVMLKDLQIAGKFDKRNEIKNIDIPVLIMTGADELLTLVEYSEYMHSQIKNSELHVIPNIKHFLPVTLNEKVAELIKDFVK